MYNRTVDPPCRRNGESLSQIARQWSVSFTGHGETSVITFLDNVEEGRAVDSLNQE